MDFGIFFIFFGARIEDEIGAEKSVKSNDKYCGKSHEFFDRTQRPNWRAAHTDLILH